MNIEPSEEVIAGLLPAIPMQSAVPHNRDRRDKPGDDGSLLVGSTVNIAMLDCNRWRTVCPSNRGSTARRKGA